MKKNKKTYIVIGSGPSGVSCATALIKKKVKVIMIDTGYKLEKDIKSNVTKLYNLKPSDLIKSKIKSKDKEYHKGIPLKKIFGSNFIYKIPKPFKYKKNINIGLKPSFAMGGFSNIWGAAIMPYNKNDIDDWPISIKKLQKYYKEVVKIFDISGQKDNLSNSFPLFKNKLINLKFNKQGEDIYNFLKKNEKILKKKGFLFGKSRLAFNKSPYSHPDGCIYCGMCLTGCPKKIIYSSESTLFELKKNKNFKYISGFTITNLKEEKTYVKIFCYNINSKKKFLFNASKVFVGAGVLQTTSIIANTLKMRKTTFKINDSGLFYLPLIIKKSYPDVQNEYVNTLSQIFFEIFDKKISKRFIHGQLYLYNSLYKKELAKYLFPIKFFFPKFFNRFVSRFAILQVYLHSEDSSKINFFYNHKKPNEINLEEIKNEKTNIIIKKILKKIKKNTGIIGLQPINLMSKTLRIGQSYHCGGTLPMNKKKLGKIHTDILGRPNNLKRIHCIDSSILPTVPATTITLSVMANAYRIGHES